MKKQERMSQTTKSFPLKKGKAVKSIDEWPEGNESLLETNGIGLGLFNVYFNKKTRRAVRKKERSSGKGFFFILTNTIVENRMTER